MPYVTSGEENSGNIDIYWLATQETANDINSRLKGILSLASASASRPDWRSRPTWARPIAAITLSSAMRSISLHACKRKHLVARSW